MWIWKSMPFHQENWEMGTIEWILPHKNTNNNMYLYTCKTPLSPWQMDCTHSCDLLQSYLLKRMWCVTGDPFWRATWAVAATVLTEHSLFMIPRPVIHRVPSQTGSFYWKEQAEKSCQNEPVFPAGSSLHDSDLRWIYLTWQKKVQCLDELMIIPDCVMGVSALQLKWLFFFFKKKKAL